MLRLMCCTLVFCKYDIGRVSYTKKHNAFIKILLHFAHLKRNVNTLNHTCNIPIILGTEAFP